MPLRALINLATSRFTPELGTRMARLSANLSVSLDTLDRDRYRRIRGADLEGAAGQQEITVTGNR